MTQLDVPSIVSVAQRPVRNEKRKSVMYCGAFRSCMRLRSRRCEIESKAFEMSSPTARICCRRLKASIVSSARARRADSVDHFLRNPYCIALSAFVWSRNRERRRFIIFSKNLPALQSRLFGRQEPGSERFFIPLGSGRICACFQ